jgi:hypothetical protein
MEQYSYTQKTKTDRLFKTKEVADICGITVGMVHYAVEKLGIIYTTNKWGYAQFSFIQMRLIKEYYKKSDTSNLKLKAEPMTLEQLKELHPLVKDERFFKLSYFPEIVPNCFAED